MLNKLKANILFEILLKRPNIEKAYKMVPPTDSWYDTITTVHDSLARINQLPHENWTVTSHDGLSLKGIYYPGCKDVTVIWIHGYTSHAERESAFPGLFYHSLGYNVLIPYLRAHGPSEGKYITLGALEQLDILRWIDRINALMPEGKIILHGLSMGGGIVLDLATREMKNVKCLIADAPSVSVEDMFRNISASVFKKDGRQVAEYAMQRFQKEFSCDAREFERVKNIKDGRYPLLLSAGSNENMEDVLDSIRINNPNETSVLILPSCNHGNGMYKQTEMFQSGIIEFINRYIKE